MKKLRLISVLLILCLTLCACDCAPGETRTIYDDFNQMVKINYTDYSIEVKSTSDGETLNSLYDIHTENGISKIAYSYEVLNPIEEKDGAFVLPEEYKTVKSGSVTVRNGKIVERDGAEIDVDVAKITGIGLKFDSTYFENESVKEDYYTAEVKNVKAFFGRNIDCTEMTIAIDYSDSRFEKVAISYVNAKSSVEIVYLFD